MSTAADEKTTPQGTLFEKLATNHPWLAEELKKNEMLILYASVVYAAEDALNLAFSYFSLGYAMKDAFHEHRDSASASEFHDFEATPEGLAITIGLSLFLFLFSAIGTYYADADAAKIGLLLLAVREFWPYMRDMLKAMKWAYKGVRSTLLLILMLAGETALLYHILFPITIVLGVLAALNRVAIRYMRGQRKKMMKENELLAAEITAKFHALTVMKEPPKDDELPRFMHALIAVQQEDASYEVFYVEKIEKDNPDQYGTEVKVYLKPIDVDKEQFSAQLDQFQNEALCQQLSYLLPAKSGCPLYFSRTLPLRNTESLVAENALQVDDAYKNAVIYLFDPTIPVEQRVYVVDENGFAKLDATLSQRFESSLQQIRQNNMQYDNVLFGVPHGQLDRIPALAHVLPEDTYHGCSYKEWSEFKAKTINEKYRYQSRLLVIWCYAAVMFSALIDSLYFYMGVLFVAMLNPHLFFAMLAMSAMLFIVCMVTRLYEEYDYQRKLHRTQILVKMAECTTESRFIEVELERLLAQLQGENRSLTKIQEWLEKLLLQVENYETLHQQREEKLPLDFWSALMTGLVCGLGFQGVISSLMFLVIAILTLNATGCPPVLVFSFMAVGVTCFLFSTIQFVVSYGHYREAILRRQSGLKKEESDFLHNYLIELKQQGVLQVAETEDFSSWTWKKAYESLADYPHLQKNVLLNAKRSMDRCALDPIQKFDLLGWWEVFRLLFSGIVKADKTYGELTLDRSDTHGESWVMFAVAIVFSLWMGGIFAVRAIGKMFPVSTQKEDPTVAPLQATTYPLPEKKLPPNSSKCLSCGFWSGHKSSNQSLRTTPLPDISSNDEIDMNNNLSSYSSLLIF